MAWFFKYILDKEIESYREQGWEVVFHRYFQGDRMSFLASKEIDEDTKED